MDFYVYLHRKIGSGDVFYVGKGFGDRAWRATGRNQFWLRTVAKYGYTVEIVQRDMQEWWAFEMERDLIAVHGRHRLSNLTDGGDGTSGMRHSHSARSRMSFAKTGRPLGPMSEDHKRKISEAQAGKPRQGHNEHARAKISAALRLRKRTDETSRRISVSLTGRRLDDAGRYALVKAHGGSPVRCVENGQVFVGASPAARWLQTLGHPKASAGAVSNCCSGRSSHAYGYRFVRCNLES